METKQLTLHVVAVHAAKTPFLFENFWSALAKAPISASAGAKEATNSTELLLLLSCFVYNHKNHRRSGLRQKS